MDKLTKMFMHSACAAFLAGLIFVAAASNTGCSPPAKKAATRKSPPGKTGKGPKKEGPKQKESIFQPGIIYEFEPDNKGPEKEQPPKSVHALAADYTDRMAGTKKVAVLEASRTRRVRDALRRGQYRLGLFTVAYPDMILTVPLSGRVVSKNELVLEKNIHQSFHPENFNSEKIYTLAYYKPYGKGYRIRPFYIQTSKVPLAKLVNLYCIERCYFEAATPTGYILGTLEADKIRLSFSKE